VGPLPHGQHILDKMEGCMNKHSQHTTRKEQQKQERKRALLKREKWILFGAESELSFFALIESFLVREIVSQFMRVFLTN